MKTYVSSREIAHLWAHQSQEHGKCSSAMSFDGPHFYSYSTVMGSIVKANSGSRVYLVNESRYSVTTSSHQSQVRGAIPRGAKVFYVHGTRNGASSSYFADHK